MNRGIGILLSQGLKVCSVKAGASSGSMRPRWLAGQDRACARSFTVLHSKNLREDDAGMPQWTTLDRVFALVTQSLVKARCLKVVRRHHEARASASERLGFGGAQKQRSEAAASILIVHPDVRKLAASTPREIGRASCRE